MLKKAALLSLAIFSAALLVSGCGSSEKSASTPQEKKEITVAATAGPHATIAEAVAKEVAKQGLTVHVKEFSDYITPDQALASGDVDLTVHQHKPFLDNFNAQNGTKLVSIGQAVRLPMGLYSNTVKSVAALPDGAIVAIPNDPTNEGRAIQLLAKAGLLKVRDGVGLKAMPADVTENPKNLQLKELEAAQLPRSLSDTDVAVIPMNYVQSAGLSPKDQGFFFEDKNSELALIIIAAREEDQNQPAYKKFADAYKSDAVKKFIADTYQGSVIPASE